MDRVYHDKAPHFERIFIVPRHQLTGKLNYLNVSKLDIAFDVSVVNQLLSAPRTTHWDAVV